MDCAHHTLGCFCIVHVFVSFVSSPITSGFTACLLVLNPWGQMLFFSRGKTLESRPLLDRHQACLSYSKLCTLWFGMAGVTQRVERSWSPTHRHSSFTSLDALVVFLWQNMRKTHHVQLVYNEVIEYVYL